MSASFFPEIGADKENNPRPDSSFEYMLFFSVCVNMRVCVCTHREMDRLGIITPSHQDILIASAQQEMLSQMQHMQHTMVPVWAGGRIQTQKNFFHLPHPCTLEGPCHRWEYDERREVKVRSEGRRKAALFVNFHTVEFSEKPPLMRTWPQIALSYSELRLKPHPLTPFYFSLFYYMFREGWHVKAVHKQNGFQLFLFFFFFFFGCFGLDLNKICFARVRLCVCVRYVTERGVSCQDVSYLWLFWICNVTERTSERVSVCVCVCVRRAGQNVSLRALTCFTLTNCMICCFFIFIIVLFFVF